MTPPGELAVPRAPVGSARETRARLPARRSSSLSASLRCLLLGQAGLVGAPARRRLLRLAQQSFPVVVGAVLAMLLALRWFADLPLGGAQVAALAALATAFGVVCFRAVAAVRHGRRASWRESVELGWLVLVASFVAAQVSEKLGLRDAPLQSVVYLAMAVLIALVPRRAGATLALLALGLESLLWWSRGAVLEELPLFAAHALFIAAFAALYGGLLGARIAAGRRAEQAALDRRRRELDERARELRLSPPGEVGEGDRVERAARLSEAAVLEAGAAARELLGVAQAALGAHTVAVWLLSEDDAELRLWECRPKTEQVVARLPSGEGVLGGVVRGRGPVRLHGNVKSANHWANGARPGALLAVPFCEMGGHPHGVLLADRLENTPFVERDERILLAIAAELSRSAAAERLIRDGRARREEMERFYQAIERLNRTTKPREVFDAVLDVAAEMVPVDFGALTVVEPASEACRGHRVARAVVASALGEGPPMRVTSDLEGLEFPDNGGLVACSVKLGSSLPGKDLKVKDAVVFDEATRLKGLSSLKVLPLRAGENVLGSMVLGARSPLAYRGDAVRQLEVIAMQAGDSLLRARLFEVTERLATTDGLTGLVNHRTFQSRLDEHLAAAQRYAKKVSLLLTDIDHFKAVNDTYGHPFGDEILRGVAKILQKEARTTDVAARYGGEEFALVMPQTDGAGALKTAERIREKVARAIFRTEQGELRVTLSIGVATFPDDADTKSELVELADGGLYHAKRHGRNRSVALALLPPAGAA
ncbi:MAG TPA: sensor domain-containing diguanylate cyclase [Anaeromyxobacteraceae bacterium]|nr:sensor domain-containing diguanylate cyclase [Anaeromyxobacteraceae bacterium]